MPPAGLPALPSTPSAICAFLPFQSDAKRLISTTGWSAAIASRAFELRDQASLSQSDAFGSRRDRRIGYPSLFSRGSTFSCGFSEDSLGSPHAKAEGRQRIRWLFTGRISFLDGTGES